MANNLRTKVETRNGLKGDWDLLLGPFALNGVSTMHGDRTDLRTYPAILVPLNLLLLSTAEASLVDELGELLLHHLFDLLDGLLEALLRGARHVKVQRRVLNTFS